MPLSLMLWALFVVPLWLLVLMPLARPDGPVWGFGVGLVVATVAAFAADRRFGAPGPARTLWPDEGRWLLLAVVAGVGMTILASEAGNVGAHLAGAAPEVPEPPDRPIVAALNGTLFHLGLVLVVVGVAERTLLAIHRPWTAVLITAMLGSLTTPMYLWPQWGLLVGLPAWLFRHTHSVAMALCACIPMVLLPVLDVAGLAPGIPGFDVIEPGTHVFQPVWFDALGALLVGLGVGPLLRDFDAIADDIEGAGSREGGEP